MVERWDRTIGAPRGPTNASGDGDDGHHGHPTSGKKTKKDKDKHKHEEQAKAADKEKEVGHSYLMIFKLCYCETIGQLAYT